MPVHPADPPFQYYLYRYHEHTRKLFESVAPGFADSIGLMVSSMHAGTHSDASLHKFAGLGAEAARWLAKRRVRLVGIDNLAAGVPTPFEVHNVLLSDNGIFLMKSLYLEELSRDRRLSCVVVVLPLKIKGGEASLVRPIAIA